MTSRAIAKGSEDKVNLGRVSGSLDANGSELELEFDVGIPDYELKDVKSFEALAAASIAGSDW